MILKRKYIPENNCKNIDTYIYFCYNGRIKGISTIPTTSLSQAFNTMNIQDFLNLAIQAIFYGLCFLIVFDFSIYATTYWTGEIEIFSPKVKPRKAEPKTLDDLDSDGVYNFGLALALSDTQMI